MELIDHLEPYEINDKYVPGKHGIVFKEFIYSPDTVYSSLDIRLRREKKTHIEPQSNNNINSSTNGLNSYRKNEKLNSSVNMMTTHSQAIEEVEIGTKLRLRLQLYVLKNSAQPELLYTWEFYNCISLQNIILEGYPYIDKPLNDKRQTGKALNANIDNVLNTVNQPYPYLITCYVDLTEAQSILDMTDIGWVIRVFSSDSVGFVKDTSKEDSEKALKDSWEINEYGRAEKAKKSRLRFLAQNKQDKGQKLTPEEEFLLKQERERKTTQNEENQKLSPKKGIQAQPLNSSKKIDKISGNKSNFYLNSTTSVPPHKDQNQIQIKKELPKPEKHISNFVVNFLYYTYQERTIIFDNELEQEESNFIYY